MLTSDNTQSLPDKMRNLAETHSRGKELVELADRLDSLLKSVWVDKNDTQKILGAWARARKLWCDCTGEPLI